MHQCLCHICPTCLYYFSTKKDFKPADFNAEYVDLDSYILFLSSDINGNNSGASLVLLSLIQYFQFNDLTKLKFELFLKTVNIKLSYDEFLICLTIFATNPSGMD